MTLRFEEGVGPERGGPPLGLWQSSIPSQSAIEGTFPKPVIAQGIAAHARGKVRCLNLRRSDIVATVADTETHTTTLTRDSSRPPLGMRCNCTCRYGYDCKHAVAALCMLAELASPSLREADTSPEPPVETFVAPSTDGHAAGNGAATNGAAGNGVRNGATHAVASGGATATAQLAELLDLLSPHHETVTPRRRLWVVIGFDERLSVFYARLALDAPKLHGVGRTHADLQQLYRTTRQANLTGEEWDRYDSALLSDASLGHMFGMPADYALARPSSEHTARLSNNFAQLLLRLIAHPRVRHDDHLGSHPESMPVSRISLSPLRLRLSGKRQQSGDLDLVASFTRPDGSSVDVSTVRTIDAMPTWLFDGQTFYMHDGSFGVRIVERFRSAASVRLTPAEIPRLLERAHALLEQDTAATLLLPPSEMEKQTLVRLRWQGDGITADAAVEDAKSGAHWPITTMEFNPLHRIDSPQRDGIPRYAYCDPAVALSVKSKLESSGFRPWKAIYDSWCLEHPNEPLPHYDETAWRMEGTDASYQFGTETLPAWRSDFHLDLDETVKSLVDGPKALHVSLSVDGDEAQKEKGQAKVRNKTSAASTGPIDWLEISVELLLDGQALSPEDVKALWQSTGRYYRLADGRFIDLSTFALLREATGGFGGGLESGGRARLTTAQMLSVYDDLAKACGDEGLPGRLRELREAVRGFSGIEEIDPPEHLSGILRPYQRKGLDFLAYLGRYAFGGILADDMGLGKTLQVLSYLERERRRCGSAPNLIVCPTSVTHTWLSEAARFVPEMKVTLLSAGSGREAVYNDARKFDLLVTSYALARRDAETLNRLNFRTIVLDEAQQIKNPQAKISQVIKGIHSEQRLALTGTPIENSVLDLWSIVDFVMPGLLGKESHFRNAFETPIMRDGDVDKQQRLARRVQPFMIRRLKTQVAADLPSRTEQTIECEMTASQKKAYRETVLRARRDILREVDERGIARAQLSILAALTKLRQICCHPGLIGDHWREDDEASGKFQAFLELLESIIESGHRVLVFSSFTEMLGLMREALDSRKRTYSYLDGSTKNRSKVLDDFRRPDGPPIFLMSLKAGGVGLTVTEADYVVLYDPWWNPAIERQAIDRTHRIGQTKPVTAYRLVTLGSVEEKIQSLQQRKQALADSVVSSDAAFAKSLTRADLDELLSPVGE
ncbi:MAG: SWIM zinc finger family protein [Candidatus Eremiobacteraeota bacterium]|nr:SWIM zinc finger family protein [Candidatus Eremiobacteraeota bacterium]MBC5807896.1 SWIM zinc finger family protein [Candidatus Eremiobacteraeota bacterium]